MSTKGLQMKAFIVTDNNLYDVNDNFLEAGKYFFIIDYFSENNSVIGRIVSSNNNIEKNTQFEFKFFSLMTMMVKGQSYLARRLNDDLLTNSLKLNKFNMPNYPSPKQNNPKRISYLKKMNKKFKCMICLEEADSYDFSFEKLKCGHKFHFKCLNEWKIHSKSCPVCRKEITINV